MKTSPQERESIRNYFSWQMPDDPVVHLEKVAIERVGSVLHDIWDVHCTSSRWWAINNSLNYYSQDEFKSRDVALTFHIGLMVRIASREEVPITNEATVLLPKAWRLWEQSIESLDGGREAEDFQAVGVRLRESMITYAGEVADDDLVPSGETAPKSADVVGWTGRLATHLAASSSSTDKQLRSYINKLARETWDYVNQLTHAKNARSYDAQIAIASVSHFLATVTAAQLRWAIGDNARCEHCGSYRMEGGSCIRCGWVDDEYVLPEPRELNDEDLATRLAEPCTPSSDISTFASPDDYR
ncbi:hypothetical protein Kisp01_69550 [Kineosporia sp. NBRC 101677]|uniref:hypothetical protein n=1 Tax=Kineosporia sp. NBRC 101677 TaxID=3032197 RepID=UPI0024A48610|nr:hypothetical protein [Kineosporia sp. NBRC 101677]GLY19941.1 hypothetical protein Kisp01_69550 [Kineosporia sp. NBRC 101677]